MISLNAARNDFSPAPHGRFAWEHAGTHEDIVAAQNLRHRVLMKETGAKTQDIRKRHRDGFDIFCYHLLVRDTQTNEIVACTRLMSSAQARIAGGFHAAQRFDIQNLLDLPGRALEVGRIYIEPPYRQSAVMATLWTGIAEFCRTHAVDFLFSCAPADAASLRVNRNADSALGNGGQPYAWRPSCNADDAPTAADGAELALATYFKLGAQLRNVACRDTEAGTPANALVVLWSRELTTARMNSVLACPEPN
ncbi:MAG: GNAT family N-acetyltransferase [Nevskiaceae bacterium]|nr:MAG: GNAT family N-acetyltransferase [Nevskiaceae bacterium]TBR71647.1 MAG: GNAT family N-acetyltransferase [Nevskiaceae bacterium]